MTFLRLPISERWIDCILTFSDRPDMVMHVGPELEEKMESGSSNSSKLPVLPFNHYQVKSIELIICKLDNLLKQIVGKGLPLDRYIKDLRERFFDEKSVLPGGFCRNRFKSLNAFSLKLGKKDKYTASC